MKFKQPRRLVASFFLIYISFALITIAQHTPDSNLEKVTGLSSTGTVSINLMPRCNIPLRDGYNLISLCANVTNSSILKVLESVAGKYDFVLRLNTSSQIFDVFSPSASTNSFVDFKENESYFIFMNQNATLGIVGTEFGDMNISLSQEFNAPSYPYQFSTNISNYLLPISENAPFALFWNETTQTFKIFSPESASQEIEVVGRGNGQFIYLISTSETLRYNRSALNSSG